MKFAYFDLYVRATIKYGFKCGKSAMQALQDYQQNDRIKRSKKTRLVEMRVESINQILQRSVRMSI